MFKQEDRPHKRVVKIRGKLINEMKFTNEVTIFTLRNTGPERG